MQNVNKNVNKRTRFRIILIWISSGGAVSRGFPHGATRVVFRCRLLKARRKLVNYFHGCLGSALLESASARCRVRGKTHYRFPGFRRASNGRAND